MTLANSGILIKAVSANTVVFVNSPFLGVKEIQTDTRQHLCELGQGLPDSSLFLLL